jgi:stress response protein SCP2
MTHAMLKGSNIPLDAAAVRAVLRWTPGPDVPDIDVSAILLGSDGRVRTDEDFVFYNQPRHPSGLVRHVAKQRLAAGLTDTVEADLSALEPSVERVVLAASSDGGSFRSVGDLCLLLYEAGADTASDTGDPIAIFGIRPETGDESALICGELYRRGDGWKFRALGQGYESGLTGLATEFGISVEDEEAPGEPAAEPAADEVPEPVPDPVPDRASNATQVSVPGPQGHPGPGHVPDGVTQQILPAYGAPPPPGVPPVPSQPAYGYPQHPAYGYPHQPEPAFVMPPQGPQFQRSR